jgi:hypothetical protein
MFTAHGESTSPSVALAALAEARTKGSVGGSKSHNKRAIKSRRSLCQPFEATLGVCVALPCPAPANERG